MDNISTKDMEHIVESSKFHIIEAGAGMARVLQHIQSGLPFFIISAFRSEYSKNINADNPNSRMKQLASAIQSKGLGFIQLRGHWIDDPKIDEEGNTIKGEDTYEYSFFVNPYVRHDGVVEKMEDSEGIKDSKYTVEKLKEIAQSLAEDFQQTSYIFGNGKDIYEVFTNGSQERYLGNHISIKQEILQGPYSDIKGKKFVFSHIMLPKIDNYIGAMGWAKQGYIPCKLNKIEKDYLSRK